MMFLATASGLMMERVRSIGIQKAPEQVMPADSKNPRRCTGFGEKLRVV
jgi:hypothetical protein